MRRWLSGIGRSAVAVAAVALPAGATAQAQARSQSQSADAPRPAPLLVDSLQQASLQEAFRVLRRRYLYREMLTHEELNRAALWGLLERLGSGARLIPESPPGGSGGAEPAWRLTSELLTPAIAYLRPAAFRSTELGALDIALGGFARSPAEWLILDLRCPSAERDFDVAAEFAERFLPANVVVFTVQRPGTDEPGMPYISKRKAVWSKSLVLLVDSETCPVGELVAASLHHHVRPLVIGSRTPGETAQYEDVPLGRDARLQYAVAQAVMEGGETYFQKGVPIGIPCPEDLDAKRKIFLASQSEGVGKFFIEVPRPRMNEAALVRRSNPELPYQLARDARGESPPETPAPIDRVLRQAVDVVVASAFFNPER